MTLCWHFTSLQYKSIIRSLLEYYCRLWNRTKISDIQELERVQKTFTARIAGMWDLHYWDRLVYLSLQCRRERIIILHIMWIILNKKTSNDLDVQFVSRPRFGDLTVICLTTHLQSRDQDCGMQCLTIWTPSKTLSSSKTSSPSSCCPQSGDTVRQNSNSLLCWRNDRGAASHWGGRKIWWPCKVSTKLNIGRYCRSHENL